MKLTPPLPNSCPIPERMKHLKVDPRGCAIPYGVVIDTDGTVHFAINNEEIRIESIQRDQCSICGTQLFRGRWLVGGPLAAFHPAGAFIDPPMHSECAHYALQVCPYLAAPRYIREVGALKAKAARSALRSNAILIDNTMIPGRPAGDLFVALMTTKRILVDERTYNLIPVLPFNVIEYWRHGKQIPKDEGDQIVVNALRDFAVAG